MTFEPILAWEFRVMVEIPRAADRQQIKWGRFLYLHSGLKKIIFQNARKLYMLESPLICQTHPIYSPELVFQNAAVIISISQQIISLFLYKYLCMVVQVIMGKNPTHTGLARHKGQIDVKHYWWTPQEIVQTQTLTNKQNTYKQTPKAQMSKDWS